MKIGEHNFVRLLQKREERALFYVLERYGGLLKSVVQKHLYRMPDRQEECMNDILMNIWENIGSFDGTKSTFKNWAAGIARYRAIDYLRKYKKELLHASLEELEGEGKDGELLQSIEREISDETEAMLSCLSPRDREIFRRLYLEEESPEEIGADLGLSRDAVYSRVSRGKKKIRSQFAPPGEDRQAQWKIRKEMRL